MVGAMTIDDWRVKYEILSAENDKLRVLLATSNANCAFCGLPAAEMAKCASGFPGCSRADDMLLCVHPTRQDLLDEVKRLREEAERSRSTVEWHAEGGATKNGLYLWAGPVVNGFASLVQRGRRRLYLDWHPSLEAARSAAVAWVDQQEGRDV